MNTYEMKILAKSKIKGNIGIMFLIYLLSGLISSAAGATVIGSFVVVPAFMLSFAKIYLGIANGGEAELKDMFSGFRDLWSVIKLYLLTGVLTALWSLLLVVPGIIKAISYSQARYILAENEGMSAMDAIKKSRLMMCGNKGKYIALQLSFIGWYLLAPFTFGILYIWLLPYVETSNALFYQSIKAEADAPGEKEKLDAEKSEILRVFVVEIAVIIFAVGAYLLNGNIAQGFLATALMVGVTPALLVLSFKKF